MKKFLSILLVAVMIFASFTACSSDTENEQKGSTTNDAGSNTPGEDESSALNEEQNALSAEEKYSSACALISKKKYDEAYALLKAAGSYAPAKEKLNNFFYAPQKISEKLTYAEDDSTRSNMTEYVYDEIGNIIETSEDKTFTYDENGNVLSGCDLIYGSDYYTYTYKDGKLYQKIQHLDSTTYNTSTYAYNADGSIGSVTVETSYGTSVHTYEYTHYENGKIKTMKVDDSVYYYDENGNTTQLDWITDEGEVEVSFKATYGEFGITKIVAEDGGRVVNYTYSYEDGKLTALLVKQYENGKLYSTETLKYSKHQLYYSENPSVQARLAQITCTDIEAAADLVW